MADTFELEPLPRDHALRSLPNTVLTPHVGYVTEATYEVFYGDTVANIAAWRAGSEPALTLSDTNLYRVHQVRLTDLLVVGWLLCLTRCLAWGRGAPTTRRCEQNALLRSKACATCSSHHSLM